MNRPPPEFRTITLAGRTVTYSVVISQKGTRVRIRVGPGGVEVIVPRLAPTGRPAEFLTERAQWVLRQLDRVDSMGELGRPRPTGEPGTVLFGGERVPLDITTDTNRPFARVHRHNGRVCVRLPLSGTVDAGKAVERWMRREARRVIEDRVRVWAKAMKRTPNRVYIRGQQTKWGNCSHLRNLSFNWRLVMAPLSSLDAIVIHELTHLIEPTHEARFWLIVRSFCPNYAECVRWLSEHQHIMSRPFLEGCRVTSDRM